MLFTYTPQHEKQDKCSKIVQKILIHKIQNIYNANCLKTTNFPVSNCFVMLSMLDALTLIHTF